MTNKERDAELKADVHYIAFRMCRKERQEVVALLTRNGGLGSTGLSHLKEVKELKCIKCAHRMYKEVADTCFSFEKFKPKKGL